MSRSSAHVPGLMRVSSCAQRVSRGSLHVLAAAEFREGLFAPHFPVSFVVAWQWRGGEQVVCVEHVVEVVPSGPCDQAVA